MMRVLTVLVFCLATAACRSGPQPKVTTAGLPPGHVHAVFMDGTANDLESETNVMQLRERIARLPDDSSD